MLFGFSVWRLTWINKAWSHRRYLNAGRLASLNGGAGPGGEKCMRHRIVAERAMSARPGEM